MIKLYFLLKKIRLRIFWKLTTVGVGEAGLMRPQGLLTSKIKLKIDYKFLKQKMDFQELFFSHLLTFLFLFVCRKGIKEKVWAKIWQVKCSIQSYKTIRVLLLNFFLTRWKKITPSIVTLIERNRWVDQT